MGNTKSASLIDSLLKSICMTRSDLDIVLRIGNKNIVGIRSFSIAWYIVNVIIAVLFYAWFFLLTSSVYVLNN